MTSSWPKKHDNHLGPRIDQGLLPSLDMPPQHAQQTDKYDNRSKEQIRAAVSQKALCTVAVALCSWQLGTTETRYWASAPYAKNYSLKTFCRWLTGSYVQVHRPSKQLPANSLSAVLSKWYSLVGILAMRWVSLKKWTTPSQVHLQRKSRSVVGGIRVASLLLVSIRGIPGILAVSRCLARVQVGT